MNEEFTITIFSENKIGVLSRITNLFTKRHINIESLTVSESAIYGIYKFTIVVHTHQEQAEIIVKQAERIVDVVRAFYLFPNEVIHQEIALYKITTKCLLEGNVVEEIIRMYNARILEMTADYTVIEKTGHKEETQELFEKLKDFGVLQFVRSGRVAVTKSKKEPLSHYLKKLEESNVS